MSDLEHAFRSHISRSMHKPYRASIYGLVGITAFGVAYDSGLFGTPDGHDHSAMISVAASTSSVSMTIYTVINNVTGEDVVISHSGLVKAWPGRFSSG